MLRKRPTPPPVLPFLLVAYALAGLLATDAYLPSLPLLEGVFQASAGDVQFTMTAYFAGVCIANLFYGPLSDGYGRRPILLLGGVGFLLATLTCAAAFSIEMLMVGRFLQGATVCSLTVTSRATVRDLYDDTRVTRLNAYIAMAEGIAPALGPVIGAEILIQLGWRWNFFLVLAMAGAALLALFLVLPESNVRRTRRALQLRPVLRVYMSILYTRDFLGPVLCAGLVFGSLMLYVTAAPFLIIDVMGYSAREFGITQAAIVFVYVIGLVTTTRFIGRLGPRPFLVSGLVLVAGSSVVMMALAWAGFGGYLAFVVPFGAYTFGIGLALAPMMTRALSVSPRATGSVASLLGTITMGCAFLGSHIVVWVYDGTTTPIVTAVAIISVCALVIYAITYWRHRPRHGVSM